MWQILDIDLSSGKVRVYRPDEKILKMFIGGKGLGAKILIDNLKAGVDPLSVHHPPRPVISCE
jgi:aldehyde:ferredoxin oxidoreductase